VPGGLDYRAQLLRLGIRLGRALAHPLRHLCMGGKVGQKLHHLRRGPKDEMPAPLFPGGGEEPGQGDPSSIAPQHKLIGRSVGIRRIITFLRHDVRAALIPGLDLPRLAPPGQADQPHVQIIIGQALRHLRSHISHVTRPADRPAIQSFTKPLRCEIMAAMKILALPGARTPPPALRFLPILTGLPRALFLAAGLAASTATLAANAPRWNILFVFADDWGRYASCYKGLDGRPTLNDIIRTPHVDRVAREGVLFKNAFVNAPSCTPCRSSLLSGRYFFNCGRGAILQGAVWDPSIPTYPLLLREAGYHIGKSYKVWSPGTPADAPFGGQAYAFEKAGRAPNNFSEEATERIRRGLSVAEARDAILAQVRSNFLAFIAARKPGQPWHYFFGPTTTHRVWVKGSGRQLWGLDPDTLKGRLPAFLPDVPEVREDVADYLGECQAVDAYVGVLVRELENLGELDRTLVILSGDHGMPGVPYGKCNLYDHGVAVALVARVPKARPGRIIEDLVCLPDLAPTFMEVAGVTPPTGLYGRSLLPLLASDRSGQVDPTRTWVITGRERHVSQAREGNLPYPMRALRTAEFVYVRNFAPDRWPMGSPLGPQAPESLTWNALETNTRSAFADMDASPTKAWLVLRRDDPAWRWHFDLAFAKRPAEELYDLRKDPDQVRNVANDPAYATIKKELAERLLNELRRAADPRVTGDGLTFDRSPFTDTDAPPRNPSRAQPPGGQKPQNRAAPPTN